MHLNRLVIHKFRNIHNNHLEFCPHKNYLFGDNAQGKTNIIEAIYLLCLAKSFRSREESDLVPFGEHDYFVEGEFTSETSLQHRVAVRYDSNQGKQIHVDHKRLNQYSKLIGLFPVISLSADDYEITAGPPAQRRRFFNILLSQSSTRYLDDLKHYEKVLKQRNLLLADRESRTSSHAAQLEVWTRQLLEYGDRLMRARAHMVQALNQALGEFYQTITRQSSSLRVVYQPNVPIKDKTTQDPFEARLTRLGRKERQQGRTLVGPHRDEFGFFIGDRELRRFGSQGEHKSALVSLKAAEARVLYERTDIHPILLLDDLYAELDTARSHHVMDLFDVDNQLFITGTTLDYSGIRDSDQFKEHQTTFFVKQGEAQQVNHVENA